MSVTTKKIMRAATKTYTVSEHAKAVLGKIWGHWIDGLHYPEVMAEKKMKAALDNLHKKETKKKASKKKSTSVKRKAPAKKAKKSTRAKARSK